MGPGNHRRTALALGAVLSVVTAEKAGGSLNWSMVAGMMAGALIGARSPDILEVPMITLAGRISVIPHRTWTHWWLPWIAVSIWLSTLLKAEHWAFWINAVVVGFIATSLMHLCMDLFSPTGIPIWVPAANYRIHLPGYRTGNASESVFALVITSMLLSLAVFLWANPGLWMAAGGPA